MFALLLKEILINAVVPVATNVISNYLKNDNDKKDDKVLQIVKESATYLSKKTNNTLDIHDANAINNTHMTNIRD